MSPVLALEGSVDYRRSDFESTKVHVWPVQASILGYLMPERRVTPFLLAGVGWYYTTIEGPGSLDETQHRFGPHIGGGVQAFLNKYWSVDASYRYVWTEDIESKDDALLEKDYDDNGSMVTVALNLHF
jgi:opacity protein-like surface antigen